MNKQFIYNGQDINNLIFALLEYGIDFTKTLDNDTVIFPCGCILVPPEFKNSWIAKRTAFMGWFIVNMSHNI